MLLFTSNTDSITEQVDALKDVADAAENVGDTLIHFNIQDYIPSALNLGLKILVILLIWFIGKKLTAFVIRFFEKSAERHGLDLSVSSFVSILIKWAMYFLIACTILNYLNIGTTSLVAVLGSAGLAIGRLADGFSLHRNGNAPIVGGGMPCSFHPLGHLLIHLGHSLGQRVGRRIVRVRHIVAWSALAVGRIGHIHVGGHILVLRLAIAHHQHAHHGAKQGCHP